MGQRFFTVAVLDAFESMPGLAMTEPAEQERAARRESIRVASLARQEAERLKLQALGFDWRQSPRIEIGRIAGHPITGPSTLAITLAAGRSIRLVELHQFYVYAGKLCGLPGDPEGDFCRRSPPVNAIFRMAAPRPSCWSRCSIPAAWRA